MMLKSMGLNPDEIMNTISQVNNLAIACYQKVDAIERKLDLILKENGYVTQLVINSEKKEGD